MGSGAAAGDPSPPRSLPPLPRQRRRPASCALPWSFSLRRRRLLLLRSALCAIGSCATKPTKPGGRSEMSGPLLLSGPARAPANRRHSRHGCRKFAH
jgi:hypothetical protein